jgi:hypothetical protein
VLAVAVVQLVALLAQSSLHAVLVLLLLALVLVLLVIVQVLLKKSGALTAAAAAAAHQGPLPMPLVLPGHRLQLGSLHCLQDKERPPQQLLLVLGHLFLPAVPACHVQCTAGLAHQQKAVS